MAATYRPTSTLSSAITAEDNTFNVAATTNIEVGDLLVWRNEVMHVRDIPVSGRVTVRRGYDGTRALAHASGETFFIGNASEFNQHRNATLGLFGAGAKVPDLIIPGSIAYDSNGYEYVLVDLTATVVQGATVVISRDGLYTAAVLTSALQGPVGILAEPGTSDQWVWAQRTGYVAHAKLVGGSSLVTSLGEFQGASSVSTPSVGLLGRSSSERSSNASVAILGMFPNAAASTASTSASSETGYYTSVWLERPYIIRPFTS